MTQKAISGVTCSLFRLCADRLLKNIAFRILIILGILFFYKFMQKPSAAPDLMDYLLRHNVTVEFHSPRESTPRRTVLSWPPMLAMIGIGIYFMRTMQASRRKSESPPGSPIGP